MAGEDELGGDEGQKGGVGWEGKNDTRALEIVRLGICSLKPELQPQRLLWVQWRCGVWACEVGGMEMLSDRTFSLRLGWFPFWPQAHPNAHQSQSLR